MTRQRLRVSLPASSFTIVVNDLTRLLHVCMPVILPPADHEAWFDPSGQNVERLPSLLRPYPSEAMEAYPVSTPVNTPAHDTPDCVARLA